MFLLSHLKIYFWKLLIDSLKLLPKYGILELAQGCLVMESKVNQSGGVGVKNSDRLIDTDFEESKVEKILN